MRRDPATDSSTESSRVHRGWMAPVRWVLHDATGMATVSVYGAGRDGRSVGRSRRDSPRLGVAGAFCDAPPVASVRRFAAAGGRSGFFVFDQVGVRFVADMGTRVGLSETFQQIVWAASARNELGAHPRAGI